MEDYYINPTEDVSSLNNPKSDKKTKSPEKKHQDELKHHNLIMPMVPPPNGLYAHPPPKNHNNDIMRRILKYLIEGLVVGLIAYYFVGKNKLTSKDAIIIGVTAALVYAILDTFWN